MEVNKKVISTVKPNEVTFDEYHVYVNTNIAEVPEEERPAFSDGNESLYSFTQTVYEKDEFLIDLSSGQITLDNRASALEDMVLEMSQVVYA